MAYTLTVRAGSGVSGVKTNLDTGYAVRCAHGVALGTKVTLSCRLESGYVFDGWYNEFGNLYSNGLTYQYQMQNHDTTLTAKGRALSTAYTVTYDVDGDKTKVPQTESEYSAEDVKSATLSVTTPSKEGYLFLGWALQAESPTEYWLAGSTVEITGNLTLYAVWRLAKFTVKFDKNTNDVVTSIPDSQEKVYGSDLVVSSMTPERKGWTFVGWADSADGEVKYQPGSSYTDETAVTLFAVWRYNDLHLFYGDEDRWAPVDAYYGENGVWIPAVLGFGSAGEWKKTE